MDTTNYRVVTDGELCNIIVGNGLTIEMIRSLHYTGDCEGMKGYMPASVLKGDKKVWSFKSLGLPKGYFGELIEYGDGPDSEFVVVVRNRTSLKDIYRVNDFVHGVMVKKGDTMVLAGGSSTEELLQIKKAMVKALSLIFIPSNEEWRIEVRASEAKRKEEEAQAKIRQQATVEAQRAHMAAAEEARQLAKRKHDEKIAEICARSKVHAFTPDGQHRIGTPVFNDEEWKCLADGKWCILMKDSEPIEAFIVSKHHAKVKKVKQTTVTGKKSDPKQVIENGPQAIGEQTVTIRGESRRVLLFASMGDVRQLRDAGLNSGTWVGVQKEKASKIDIYAMNHDGIMTLGVVQA